MKATRTHGFSLIEVMCAIVILGIGVTGLTHGLNSAVNSSKETEVQTAAALMAAGQIEMLRADVYVVAGEDEGEGGAGLEQYRWRQSIVETPMGGLFEVTVTVEHVQTGKTIYQLQTMLFDPPTTSTTPPEETQRRNGRRPRTGGAL